MYTPSFVFRMVLLALWSVFFGYACKRENPPSSQNKQPLQTRMTAQKNVTPEEAKRQVIQQKAMTVIAATFKTLSGRLGQAIQQGGVTAALDICSTQAIPLTEASGKKFGVTVARVSHKPRNLNNSANTEELGIIKNYVAALAKSQPIKPVVLEKVGQAPIVYAPILLVMPVCLKCHGAVNSQIQPKDYAQIRKLYPQDQAVGFNMGELRGLWKVTFPATPVSPQKKPL